MSSDTQNSVQHPRFLLFIVEKVLPRGVRKDYLEHLEELCLPLGDWVLQSMRLIKAGYTNQVILAFDTVALSLQLAGMAYCFSAASVPAALGVVLGGILGCLILRSAYTYQRNRRGKRWVPSSRWQDSLDSIGDAAVTMVVVLLSQALTQMIAPDLALRSDLLYRSCLLGVPMLGAMRMALRPRSDRPMPFRGSKLSSTQIFWKTWGLTLLWIFACQNAIIINPDTLPDWFPNHDFFRCFIPTNIFVIWFRIQQNALVRRDYIETLFGDWEKKKKARYREILLKGMNKGEPLYWAYVALQGLLFFYLSIPLASTLWPWLAGGQTDMNSLQVAVNAVTLIVLAWTWNYVKEANRAAADALQQDIDAPDTAVLATVG